MSEEFNIEKEQLADMIKRLRSYVGLSQRELSSITGISQADICKLERGLSNPSLSTVSRIMEATGARLKVDYVIDEARPNFLIESWGNASEKIIEVSKESAILAKNVLGDDADSIVLYGSCARGENTADSDVDIAIFTKCDRLEAKKYSDKLAEIATRMMAKYLEVVNFVCLPVSEYLEKKSWYPYFQNIERDGVVIYGRR